MNCYILNGMAGHLARQAIIKGLDIEWNQLYKTVKSIDNDGIITLHDGRKFKLELKELNETN